MLWYNQKPHMHATRTHVARTHAPACTHAEEGQRHRKSLRRGFKYIPEVDAEIRTASSCLEEEEEEEEVEEWWDMSQTERNYG